MKDQRRSTLAAHISSTDPELFHEVERRTPDSPFVSVGYWMADRAIEVMGPHGDMRLFERLYIAAGAVWYWADQGLDAPRFQLDALRAALDECRKHGFDATADSEGEGEEVRRGVTNGLRAHIETMIFTDAGWKGGTNQAGLLADAILEWIFPTADAEGEGK